MRYADTQGVGNNVDVDGALLTEAAERLKLTARGYHRVLRVARTLADSEGVGCVRRLHVAEALSYRRLTLGRANRPGRLNKEVSRGMR